MRLAVPVVVMSPGSAAGYVTRSGTAPVGRAPARQ